MIDGHGRDEEMTMKSMWQEATRRELQDRLATLTPGAPGQWGRFTAPQMVAHIAESYRSSLGELAVRSRNLPLRYTPLKQLVIYWLPFPKNAPTAPELLARKPGDWASDVAAVHELMDRFVTRNREDAWPVHAAFGRLSGKQWGILMYRHTDHHFRQFGV
jgi:hypothetical protein